MLIHFGGPKITTIAEILLPLCSRSTEIPHKHTLNCKMKSSFVLKKRKISQHIIWTSILKRNRSKRFAAVKQLCDDFFQLNLLRRDGLFCFIETLCLLHVVDNDLIWRLISPIKISYKKWWLNSWEFSSLLRQFISSVFSSIKSTIFYDGWLARVHRVSSLCNGFPS